MPAAAPSAGEMASLKKLVFKVLEGVLGDYIVGFNPEQIKVGLVGAFQRKAGGTFGRAQVGLWSGKMELVDLEVNTAAIAKLGLPLGVSVGRVARLYISIPWTSLGSTPVRIGIEVRASRTPGLRGRGSTCPGCPFVGLAFDDDGSPC